MSANDLILNELKSINSSFLSRNLAIEDLEQILELEAQVSSFPWSEKAHRDGVEHHYPSLVLVNEDKIIGFVVFNYYVDECHLLNIAIHKDYQRLGLAKQLIQTMVKQCIKKQMVKIILEVRESNLLAIKLYHSLQFSEIGRRKNYYRGNSAAQSKHEDAIVLEKAL